MAKYKFKGYTISCCGYHKPDHCVWWEAVDDSGCACFHGTTLREVEFMILDSDWEDKLKAKDREIAELRECLKETMVIAIAEYHNNSCFKNVKCGEIERCKTCKVVRWRKALQDEGGAE